MRMEKKCLLAENWTPLLIFVCRETYHKLDTETEIHTLQHEFPKKHCRWPFLEVLGFLSGYEHVVLGFFWVLSFFTCCKVTFNLQHFIKDCGVEKEKIM